MLSKRESQGGDPGAYLLGEPSWHLTTPTGSGNSAYPPQTNKFSASSGKTVTNLKIGKDGGSSSFDFAGDIAEVLIFDRELSSEEANQVEGYLAHRWGAIDSLLPYHPHKEFPPSFENSPKIKMKAYVNEVVILPTPLNPLHINNPAPNVWFDANDTATLTGSSPVTAWNDKSGNQRTATRTAGTLTLVTANAVNGMPVVNFADNTYANITGNMNSKQQYIVFNLPNVGDWGSVLGSQKRSGYMFNRNGSMWNQNYPTAVRQNGGAELSGNFQLSNIGNYMVVRITGNSNDTSVRAGWALGRQEGWGRLGMNLAEVVSFGTTLSVADEYKMEGYLAHKWGLTGNLPATHRYKSSKPMFSPYDNAYELHMGTPVSLQVEATKGPDTYSTDSTLAEYGLSIDSNTGVISGTPSKMGDFNCTITVMNSSASDTKSFFFRVLKGTKSINWDQSLVGLTYGDVPVELNASATIGGVSYSSSDKTILEFGGTEVRNPTLENGLVRYWTFDEANGSTSSDVRGSFDGMLAGGAAFVPGKFGNAVEFDGSTAEVDFGLGAGDLGDKFTVSIWVKWTGADSPANAMRILENKNDSNSSDGWGIFTESSNDTNALVRGSSDAAISSSVTTSWKANDWHHIVAVFNDANLEVFADGSSRASGVIAPVTPGGKSLKMGKWHNGNANTFKGLMDDLRLYDKVLTVNEVATLFGGGSGDFARSSNGTVGTIKNTGTVTLTAHASGTKYMYSANTVSKTVTIGKAPLTVSADDKTRNVGVANPTFTHFVSGFVNDDNETTGLTSSISLSTDANASSPEGTYAIVPTSTSDKYFITYLNGSLIVSNKTSQSITWTQDFSNIAVNQFVDLNASSTSGLPVLYAIENPDVAEAAVSLQGNLDAWWKMDSSDGSTILDSSGQGGTVHNGILQGTDGSSSRAPGKFGNALTLDGTDDYVLIPGYAGITGKSLRTIALWFKTTVDNRPLLSYGGSGNGALFAISLNAGKVSLDLGGTTLEGGTSLADGGWHHLAVVVPMDADTSAVKLYVDGAHVASGSGSTPINTKASSFVKLGSDGANYFNGELDDVRFYAADLNAITIAKVYGAGIGDFNRIRLKSAGTAVINASQPGDATFSPSINKSIQITVGKLDQTIAFAPMPNKSIGDFDFGPEARASSGLFVTYQSSNPLVASVEGITPGNQTIKIRSAGTTTITATQPGDLSHNPATATSQVLSVGYYKLFKESISGMELWLDGNNVNADSLADSITSGSPLYIWNDSSGNNRNAIQGTAVNAPIYKKSASELTGKGFVDFSSVTKTLELPAVNGPKTIFAIFRQTGLAAKTKLLGGDLVSTSTSGKVALQREGGNPLIDSSTSAASFHIATWQGEAGSYALHVDGAAKGSGTDAQSLGALTKVGNGLIGQVTEIVVYNRVLPSPTQRKIEGYLAHKWGLPSQLPSVHPYKNLLPTFGGEQQISFQPISDKLVGSNFQLAVTSDSGLTHFIYESNDSSIASITGNTVSTHKEGKVTITAIQPGDYNWFLSSANRELIVTSSPRTDQTITFGPLSDKTALAPSFELNATASSGLPVSYQSSNPAVATITGSNVSIVSQGVTTIRVSQDGNGSFNAAPFVEQQLTVTKVSQTITFAHPPAQPLGAGTFILEANASSRLGITFVSDTPSVGSILGNTVSLLAGGTTRITAIQQGNATYESAPDVTRTLTVVDVFANMPPTVANALPDLNATEDDANVSINLANVFDDKDNNNSNITKTALSGNVSLLTATATGNILELDFQPNAFGSTIVTVTGTSNGMTVNDSFLVTVAPVDDSPVTAKEIADVNVTEDASDALINLSNIFNDIDDDNASITKTAKSSDTTLVDASVSGETLTLDFQANGYGSAIVTVTAHSNGKSVDHNVTVTVLPVDDGPVAVHPIADINVTEDSSDLPIDLSNVFNDVDDDNASIVKTATSENPNLVSSDVVGNMLTLDFQDDQFGSTTITITGSSNGKSVDDNVTVTVTPVDDPPVVENPIADVQASEDDSNTTLSIANVFNDVDDDNSSIVKTAISSNSTLVVTKITGDVLTLDYQLDNFGSATVTVTGNSNGQSVDHNFTVIVEPVDDPPILANPIADINVTEDAGDLSLELANVFNDVDDDNASIIKIASSSNPEIVSTTVNGQILILNFQADSFGPATITVIGTSNGKTIEDSFEVNVAPVDDGPEVINGIADVSAEEDASDFIVSLVNVFNDVDDDNASIGKTLQANSEPGLVTATIAGNTLTLDFQPNQFGSSTITLLVSSNGKTIEDSFEVNVTPVDDAPEVINGIADVSVEEDASDFIVSLANVFNDIDDDNASIVKTVQANTNPGLLTATISANDLILDFQSNRFGSTTITVRGTSNGKIIEDSFEVNVAPVDDGPEVSIGIVEVSVEEDASDFIVSLANLFNDIDDDNASILKTAQANTSPGLVTATVAGDELTLDFQPDQFGNATITVRGTSNGKTVEDSFEVNVSPVDDDPEVINGIADVSVEEDAADFIVSLANVFNDVDDDNASIVKTVQANTNPGLLTATIEGDNLTLNFKADQFGSTTIIARALSNGLNVEESFDVNVSPVDDAPVVLNPIADLSSLNTGPNVTIDLSNVFNDVDDDNASIQKTVVSGNPALVSTSIVGDILTLDFQADANGSTTVTVTATSNDQTVDAVFRT